MGDKSLMKKISILLILILSVSYADLSVNQIRDMVTKIHQKREGINIETLSSTKEPFLHLIKENNTSTSIITQKEEETELILHAILNKKAYINNEWKKIDDTVDGYVLKYIGTKGVVLRNENRIKKLFLHKEGDNFIEIKERE